MPNSAPPETLDTSEAFLEVIDQCFELYRSSAEVWNQCRPPASAAVLDATRGLMEDLARGLMIKTFLAIVRADRQFSFQERQLAVVLIEKAWGRQLELDEVGAVLLELAPLADRFDWFSLVRPFDEVPALRDRIAEVETLIVRFGNLVAKADGTLTDTEALQLKGMLVEVKRHLRPVAIEEQTLATAPQCEAIRQALNEAPGLGGRPDKPVPSSSAAAPTSEKRLQAAMESLDGLIGLESIKNEVRELTRFLRVQQHRQQAGLPRTQVSLHTVFAGNPGTGKTSVARILGEVFGALGMVTRGHLVEADRALLVAGYMGQTAERTNKIIDRALDGVLFIDEAYSLVNSEGDDPYGHEALQILLKRMEDDRDRLIVVLAGYPDEMERLLASNPGLASRFQRQFDFPDYGIVDLCRIFQSLCEKNHYLLPPETRARLILVFRQLLAERDEQFGKDRQFGNGRVVRNLFEHAIRRLADRVADVVPLTNELLTRLQPEDICLPDREVTDGGAEIANDFFVRVICTGCQQLSKLQALHLGRRVQCKKCQVRFIADWGEPIAT